MHTSDIAKNSSLFTLNSQLPIRRIAVFRALFLGDLLCAVPALRALRRRYPAAEITLIGLPWAAGLVARLPYVDRLLPFPGYPGINQIAYEPDRTAAFLAEARAYGYDLAIQMHGDGSVSNGFVSGLGARISLGYRRGDDNRLTASLPYQPDEHEILRWLRLAGADWRLEIGDWRLGVEATHCTGLQAASTRTEFPIMESEHARAAALLALAPGRPLICIHPGAKDEARRWPPQRFAVLADTLIERYGAAIALTGSAGERMLTAAVRSAMRHPALDLAGTTDLGTFAAVIARLDLLVTNDTGASHLAAATRTPSVILFGPSRPAQWAPLDREHHRPIDALAHAGPGAEPGAALRDLPVAPVLEECVEILAWLTDHRPPTALTR